MTPLTRDTLSLPNAARPHFAAGCHCERVGWLLNPLLVLIRVIALNSKLNCPPAADAALWFPVGLPGLPTV